MEHLLHLPIGHLAVFRDVHVHVLPCFNRLSFSSRRVGIFVLICFVFCLLNHIVASGPRSGTCRKCPIQVCGSLFYSLIVRPEGRHQVCLMHGCVSSAPHHSRHIVGPQRVSSERPRWSPGPGPRLPPSRRYLRLLGDAQETRGRRPAASGLAVLYGVRSPNPKGGTGFLPRN